jgi:hypothetical protein
MINLNKLVLVVACAHVSLVISSQQPQKPTQKRQLAVPKKFVWNLTPEDQDAIDANRYMGTISSQGPVNGNPVLISNFHTPIDKKKKEADEAKTAACLAALQKAMTYADNNDHKK